MMLVCRVAYIVILVLMEACAKTQQAKEVVRTGFLDDYSILQKGGGDKVNIFHNHIIYCYEGE